jgi:hypothetical protein
MPVYEFENPKTGERREMVLPVAQRDCGPVGFLRITVPQRINVVGLAPNPHAAENQVLTTCRRLEETHRQGSSAFRRELDFTPDQMKTLWSEDYRKKHIKDYESANAPD